jgi:ATPase subunit of ABC transporter with duplicated ATPase domains
MTLDELSVWYWTKTLISINHKLEVTKDMRIGVIWKNGIWKTTLLKTILWELPAVYGGNT